MPIDLKAMVFSSVRKDAMPIYQIAKQIGLSVQTTSKYCHILQAERRIEIEKFGNMKLIKRRQS